MFFDVKNIPADVPFLQPETTTLLCYVMFWSSVQSPQTSSTIYRIRRFPSKPPSCLLYYVCCIQKQTFEAHELPKLPHKTENSETLFQNANM